MALSLPAGFMGLAKLAQGAFGAPYYAGRVIDQGATVYDDGGSIVTPSQPVYRDCMVQIDAATEAMRQADGYVDGDVRFIVLADSLDGALNTDAAVSIATGPFAGKWQVSQLQRDPAGIGWIGRGRRA